MADKDGKPGEQVNIAGTGFWVSVPDSRLANGASFIYLVTNRHLSHQISMRWNQPKVAGEQYSTSATNSPSILLNTKVWGLP